MDKGIKSIKKKKETRVNSSCPVTKLFGDQAIRRKRQNYFVYK
jgi:hypothetical protein